MKESLPVWIDWQKKKRVLANILREASSALKFPSCPSLGGVVTHIDSTSDEVNLLKRPAMSNGDHDNSLKISRTEQGSN
ncbi:unnamed protein product [Brassica oleracea var. botrytis]|uniref:Uncharacterized protein n=1 Tax=Brassica oleracea TaxID=3712 RepID=A0A3P6FE82_BRAOL|nr:unnamed protein product [Brassica oleracea]